MLTFLYANHFLTTTPKRSSFFYAIFREFLPVFFNTSKWHKHLLILRSQFLHKIHTFNVLIHTNVEILAVI